MYDGYEKYMGHTDVCIVTQCRVLRKAHYFSATCILDLYPPIESMEGTQL